MGRRDGLPGGTTEDDGWSVTYDDMLVESAVLAYVLNEQPDGATIPELSRLMLAGRSADREADAVERAVRELVRGRLLHREGDKVVPGPAAAPEEEPRGDCPVS